MQALWLYIKHNKLQDSHEKEFINCNRYFRQVPAPSHLILLGAASPRLPQPLQALLGPLPWALACTSSVGMPHLAAQVRGGPAVGAKGSALPPRSSTVSACASLRSP